MATADREAVRSEGRVARALLAMVLLFIWGPIPAMHRPAGIIVFLALALLATHLLRRQTAREFPQTGVATVIAGDGALR